MYPLARYDLIGHSLGGAVVQLLAGQFLLDNRQESLGSLVTFGSLGIDFEQLKKNQHIPFLGQLADAALEVDADVTGWIHFVNEADKVPNEYRSELGLSFVGGDFRTVTLATSPGQKDAIDVLDGLHSLSEYHINTLSEINVDAIQPFGVTYEAEKGAVLHFLGSPLLDPNRGIHLASAANGATIFRVTLPIVPPLLQIDPIRDAR